jgi:hypothetical protein
VVLRLAHDGGEEEAERDERDTEVERWGRRPTCAATKPVASALPATAK